ncbi:MAG: permease, partial [Acidobacteriota bacterium]
MDHWTRDLRYALRTLAKSPLFTLVAIATLALGIGVNATIFSFVDAVLLAPPPIDDPDEVVAVFSSWDEEPWATTSYLDYRDLRDQNEVFSGLCGTSMAIASL